QANITDNDAATAALSVSANGAEGGANVQYTVTMSKANSTGSPITFDIARSGGTAIDGTDITAIAGGAQVTIANGASSGTFSVVVLNDLLLDGTRTLQATISNPSNGGVTISGATATANITDNETA